MSKKSQRSKKSQKRPQLIRPPQMWINIGVIAGGAVGFLVQDALNQDNMGAFIVTAMFCFLGVIVVNAGWLIHTRRT